ncbi:adhesin [Escherichia marmotae]|nr:adhesin [Escherichia marmotae]MEC9606606.1 adhesin [Escherichia marmotae]MED0232842.1 adhesin [Escherichia marmotae]MED0542116.1 adhesin [Escherichia marmotae]MED8761338.1 adhesin [Escherichia marmotae]MED8805774.1 adhesin [Escherichia marmotae]
MRKIISILTLVSNCVTVCAATESNWLSSDYVVMTSFHVEEVTNLAHPVCTLNLESNKDKDSYNYVEGGICPAGKPTGKETCAYSAIIELNHKIIIAKQVSSGKDTAIFKNKDVTIITRKMSINSETIDDEGEDVKYSITIKTKGSESIENMFGYCGI